MNIWIRKNERYNKLNENYIITVLCVPLVWTSNFEASKFKNINNYWINTLKKMERNYFYQ